MRIGVIGCGVIASAAVRGIAGDGHQITLSERSAHLSAGLAAEFDDVTVAPNQAVIDTSDVILLGLMAEVAVGVLEPLEFRKDQRVISFMAGATLKDVAALVRPAEAAAIVIPFPGIAKGGSPILVLGETDLVAALFGEDNRLFPLNSDAELSAYLCAQAVLSPVACIVGEAANWLGERIANRAAGEAFLRELVASSLSDSDTTTLIDALNTPGGYNQRLRLHMEDNGLGPNLKAGLDKLA